MKIVYPLGMLVLVGAIFLALGAPSVSARAGDVTAAETHVNATPRAVPPAAPAQPPPSPNITPTPVPPNGPRAINPEAWPVPIPGQAAEIRPWGLDRPVPVPVSPQPIDGTPSFVPIPEPIVPTPAFEVA